jgi:hypothetical protein
MIGKNAIPWLNPIPDAVNTVNALKFVAAIVHTITKALRDLPARKKSDGEALNFDLAKKPSIISTVKYIPRSSNFNATFESTPFRILVIK